MLQRAAQNREHQLPRHRVSLMADDGDADDAWTDFGQKVDLCVRLRDVLVNYPEGALLKEMTQNADDAGASTFKVVLDLRSHDSRSLSFPGTAEFQGPALLTYNDAVFTDTGLASGSATSPCGRAGEEGTRCARAPPKGLNRSDGWREER